MIFVIQKNKFEYVLSSRVRLKKSPYLLYSVAESFHGADVVVRIRDERLQLWKPLRVVVSGESINEEGRKVDST